jgi:hypothetical protein
MIRNSDSHLRDEELLAAADGESLSAEQKRHVETCVVCTNEIAGLRQALSHLREAPEPNLPPRLRRDLLQTYRSRRLKRRPFRRILSWRMPVYQAACLMVGAILVWEVVIPRREVLHQRAELLEELPAFTAALPEFAVEQYSIDPGRGVLFSSRPSHQRSPGKAGSSPKTAGWPVPSMGEPPEIDSCDVDTG